MTITILRLLTLANQLLLIESLELRCPLFNNISRGMCGGINDVSAQAIADKRIPLKERGLHFCEKTTVIEVFQLMQINVHYSCEKITNVGLSATSDKYPLLNNICILSCKNIIKIGL